MNREETIKVIQDYTEYFNKAKEQGRTVTVFDYMDSLDMNKEKAIGILERWLDPENFGKTVVGQALQFAIDYMKKSEDEGDIIGWVNYYPDFDNFGKSYQPLIYSTDIVAHGNSLFGVKSIQIPIRKPL